MTGFEPQTSSSTNWATTTAHDLFMTSAHGMFFSRGTHFVRDEIFIGRLFVVVVGRQTTRSKYFCLLFIVTTLLYLGRSQAVWPDWAIFEHSWGQISFKSSPSVWWLFGHFAKLQRLLFGHRVEKFGLGTQHSKIWSHWSRAMFRPTHGYRNE